MAYWEFLLQKEGDRSWLPLESPDVEILEGRYRVVARSNRVNTPVEVRIIHQLEEANQPKRRTQKRTTKTNQDGLMVVLPFTWLPPGVWELRCSSDVMADMLGEGWQHTVQLDVQPQDSTVDDGDWSFDTEDGAIATEDTTPAQPVLPPERVESPIAASFAEPLTEAQAPETAIQGAETTIQAPAPTAAAERSAADLLPPVPVRVQMDQDSYATRASLPLVLTGRIVPEGNAPTESSTDAASPSVKSTESSSERLRVSPQYIRALRVRLLNPQTGDALTERTLPLEVAVLPFAFTCHLDNPEGAETHLLIGQLTVLGADDNVLAQQSFTVTTDLEALLQAIADDSLPEADDSAALTSPFGMAEPPDLTLLNLISKADTDAEPQFQVTHTEPIPPQIYHPEPTEEAPRKALDLPDFSVRTPVSDPAVEEAASLEAMALSESNVEALDDASAIAPPLDLNPPHAAFTPEATLDPADDLSLQPSAVAPTAPAIAPSDATTAIPELGTSKAAVDASVPGVPTVSLSPTDLEFQALNLQDRFLARLSAMASDADLHSWLQSQYPTSTAPSRTVAQNGHLTNGSSTTLTPDRLLPLENAHASREFVIEDDEQPDSPPDASSPPSTAIDAAIPESLKIPADQPIPAPEITLPNRDLIAGQPLQILVNLPSVRPRLSVKFWLQDPQTRDLLDGPYWLTTFIPNGHDQLEAGLQVMVPFGCVEVQFEAIAIEVSTQRESRKVSVHRTVIPPDLSTLPVDDINF